MESLLGVADVVVLTKGAAQVAHGEEDAAGAVVSLDARFLAKVRRDHVDDDIGADEAHARLGVAVHAAEPGTEVAVSQVRVRPGSLLCRLDRGQGHVSRHVVIHQEGRRKVKRPALDR